MEPEFFKGDKTYYFPIGQKVCGTCLTKIKSFYSRKTQIPLNKENASATMRFSKLKANQNIDTLANMNNAGIQSPSQFIDCTVSSVYAERLPLNDINQLLTSISNNIDLLKYQIQQSVHDLFAGTIWMLKHHYESIMKEFLSFICECFAPSQGEKLHELFEENLDSTTQSILEAYHFAPSRKWQYFFLSTVSKQFTNDVLLSMFGCNRYMIGKSRSITHHNDQFNSMEKRAVTRYHSQGDASGIWIRPEPERS
ncbi:unnamed protein product [Adineta ricciae]|uniref:Uncharacterized protein n=1 Tax=Adineta ricciae TaxID=249248 RepID=A0A815VEU8_ADIRI|nr:unnamed protein product [Adineta ricciae]CAF1534100.1 unnamed protein product [Adineta ricciae]